MSGLSIKDMADWAASLPPATTRLVPIRDSNGVWVVGYEEKPIQSDGLCATGKTQMWVDIWYPLIFSAARRQGITAPPGTPLRHRHRRANFNKHARHAKRPNGRPKHR